MSSSARLRARASLSTCAAVGWLTPGVCRTARPSARAADVSHRVAEGHQRETRLQMSDEPDDKDAARRGDAEPGRMSTRPPRTRSRRPIRRATGQPNPASRHPGLGPEIGDDDAQHMEGHGAGSLERRGRRARARVDRPRGARREHRRARHAGRRRACRRQGARARGRRSCRSPPGSPSAPSSAPRERNNHAGAR